jgi:Uncharacterised MFS-type transporter YbfB
VLAAMLAHDAKTSAAAIATYYGGAGLGVLLSGIGLPWLLAGGGIHAWKEAWLALGVGSLLALGPSYWATVALSPARSDQPAHVASVPWRFFLPAVAGYFLFGLGYIAYMTFVIAWMRNHGAGTAAVASVWGALGLAMILSPIPWRKPLASWRGGYVLGAANFVITLGAGLPLAGSGVTVMLLSAVLFGGAGMVNSAAITALAKKSLAQAAWGPAVRGSTVAFAIGQSIGPVLAGVITDKTGSLQVGLGLSVLILLCSAVVALFQKDAQFLEGSREHFRELLAQSRGKAGNAAVVLGRACAREPRKQRPCLGSRCNVSLPAVAGVLRAPNKSHLE